MSLSPEFLSPLKERAKKVVAIGHTLQFDFGGDDKITIDGTGSTNEIIVGERDAECVVTMSLENFESMLSGNLNPITAVMTGKIKIKGDMSIALKLKSLIS
ncbi:MAG: SCP2 sterol-binding domain-containing protein [Phycisphaerales bacterium]|nr:SCP2 sterol-binding domain-containing protein [Phycisphaerales bacterium]